MFTVLNVPTQTIDDPGICRKFRHTRLVLAVVIPRLSSTTRASLSPATTTTLRSTLGQVSGIPSSILRDYIKQTEESTQVYLSQTHLLPSAGASLSSRPSSGSLWVVWVARWLTSHVDTSKRIFSITLTLHGSCANPSLHRRLRHA